MTKNREKSGKLLKILPLGDRVLVDPGQAKEAGEHKKTASGLYIPETAEREKPEQGKVLAVGEGFYDDGELIPLKVKIGDTVLFSKYGYDEVKIGDKKYFIIKNENILAIIK